MNDLASVLAKVDWEKMGGLVPVIVQDINTKSVLMQAYVDQEALRLTIKTGKCHYFSRSRKTIWQKGETSGNIQYIKEICIDCDGDCILYKIVQKGVACHTGEYSCFFEKIYGE
ncbi:phosphoribosyl-AMP cyclohydrolase [Deferribacter abyssi]|uniref:phosphoribosyl-AMP cyclohydrolase n=1 Tax=Deferribacter abyssi TaxID=213806 RepID=UPI003C29DEC1